MAKSGDELGVELAELWLCGRSYLPHVAEAFLDANRSMAESDGAGSRFARPAATSVTGNPTGSVSGAVFPVWDRLRDELQRRLAESADNLYDTGDALVRVADLYAATDCAAAAKYKADQDAFRASGSFLIEDPEYRRKPVLPD